MNLKRIVFCILFFVLGFALSPLLWSEEAKKTGEAKSDDKIILAEIGDQKITLQDLNRRISELPMQYRGLFSDPERKVELLNALVQQTVLSKKAKELKIDQIEDVSEKLNDITNQILSQELVKEVIVKKVNISDEEIKKYYDKNSDKYKEPEMVKARHILIKVDPKADDEAKNKAEAKAKEILARAKKGEDFVKLAEEFSDDSGSKGKGGDLGFFNRGRMVKEFEEVAFKLKPGEISDLVKTKFGYHIIKVEGKKQEHQKTLAEVKSSIKDILSREKMKKELDDYTKKLYQESKVTIHSELLKSNEKPEEGNASDVEESVEESAEQE